MYSSKDLRSRRYQAYQPDGEPRSIKPGWLILGALAVILILCCCCGGALLVFLNKDSLPLPGIPNPLGSLPSPSATKSPTPDVSKPVPMRTRAIGDNGLEVTVLNFQRPLKVEGLKGVAPDQQFVLVTIRVRNSKSTGAPIPINAADFTMMGDGGLTYTANPKNITISQLLTQATVAPGREMSGELIFQIAVNDANLRLFWNGGGTNRIFLLEESQ